MYPKIHPTGFLCCTNNGVTSSKFKIQNITSLQKHPMCSTIDLKSYSTVSPFMFFSLFYFLFLFKYMPSLLISQEECKILFLNFFQVPWVDYLQRYILLCNFHDASFSPFVSVLSYPHHIFFFFFRKWGNMYSNSQFANISYLDFLLTLHICKLPTSWIHSRVFSRLSIEPSLSSIVALWLWDSLLFPLSLSVVLWTK